MPQAVSPFPWFGGKDRLAQRIAGLLPEHRAYVEVFGGSAAVLFAKQRSKLEIYNDIDQGVVAFFRCLRDQPDELQRVLTATPYSRSEYIACRETWRDADISDVERARRWLVTTFMAFGGGGKGGSAHARPGFAYDVRGRKNGSRARTFAWRVDRLHDFADRLRTVQIENLEWRDILKRYDNTDAVFYLDPPYLPETRSSGTYAHELSAEDHEEMIGLLPALAASVVLSGYQSALYLDLEAAGFERFEFEVHLAAAKTIDTARQRRVEIVWVKSNRTDRLFTLSGAAA